MIERGRLELGLARRDRLGHRLLEQVVAGADLAPRLGVELAEALVRPVMRPFLPSALTRTSSSAARSRAAATSFRSALWSRSTSMSTTGSLL